MDNKTLLAFFLILEYSIYAPIDGSLEQALRLKLTKLSRPNLDFETVFFLFEKGDYIMPQSFFDQITDEEWDMCFDLQRYAHIIEFQNGGPLL